MKILVLLPLSSQPRLIKRVQYLIDSGHEVTVAYQIRNYFKKNQLPDDCVKVPLVKVENKKYHKRINSSIISIIKLMSLKEKFDLIYSFSFDLLLISLFLRTKKRYYEIGDIRIVNLRLYDFFYEKMLNRQNKIIVTSIEFSFYLQKKYSIDSKKIKVVENKLDANIYSKKTKSKQNLISKRRITVGIIGLLRYKQIIDFLDAIKSDPIIRVNIYGNGMLMNEIEKYVDNKQVFYNGEFKYPEDLEYIYSNIDFSFVMYDSTDLNVRLALPNKLYESIYFQIPIIVSSNTHLEERVLEHGVGLSCSIDRIDKLPSIIMNTVYSGIYDEMVNNCKRVPNDVIYKTEDEYNIIE